VKAAHPYGPDQLRALDGLLRESTEGVVTPLPEGAPGKARWDAWAPGYVGRPWLELPFLWAESYFYRRLLDALGWYPPGPWAGVDPFGFLKSAELLSSTVDTDLAVLHEATQTRPLVYASLWGNQADLGFRIGGGATDVGGREHILVDDTDQLLACLPAQRIQLVTDNSGRELLADLVLVDQLLRTGRAGGVEVHVKPYPYYVSDVTTADLAACLGRLAAGPPPAQAVAGRLLRAAHGGRLSVTTHGFHAAPLPFDRMPADLADRFESADLVVVKGDLNYRRLVGDRWWPPTVPFAALTGYFPAPLVALRTLKSEVCVGLPAATAARLDATGEAWRTSGRYAVVQANLGR
jgi:hypothetical protein